jgi:hypothetical protein
MHVIGHIARRRIARYFDERNRIEPLGRTADSQERSLRTHPQE